MQTASEQPQIFVTGGTGFLGAYLLRDLLAQGYTRIRALKRKNSPMALVTDFQDRIEWVEGGLLDFYTIEDALQGVEQLYHCAAIVSYDPREAGKMLRTNEEGTANLVNAALYQKVGRLIHVSSIAAIGRNKSSNTLTERNLWERNEFNTNYAISKYKSEMQVWRAMAEGLNAAIVNPSIILGSGFWDKGPAAFFKRVWDGLRFYPPGATGFVDVRDVTRFMIQLMNSDISNERYILSGTNESYLNVFTTIAQALEQPAPSIRANRWMRGLVWRLEWLRTKLSGQRPLITRETAHSAARTWYFDNQKSLSVFSDFQYTPIEKTISQTAAQFEQAVQADLAPVLLPQW
ncbi:MAG: NAD-dependent epimerase/dehydratase family protein [Bacteroidota bacterium]